MNVAVIILAMNQRDKTMRCLSTFGAVKSPLYRIILWDNGSQDGTVEAVCQAFPEVITRYRPENIGVASERNAAARIVIESLDPAYLLFLDGDSQAWGFGVADNETFSMLLEQHLSARYPGLDVQVM